MVINVINEYLKVINMIYEARSNLFKNTKIDQKFREEYLKKYDEILNRQYELLWNIMEDTTNN